MKSCLNSSCTRERAKYKIIWKGCVVMKPYNIAIIGTGMIFNSHLAAIGNLENARCAAVADIVEERAKKAGGKAACPYYTDAKQMLDAQKDIDICIISTPTYTHADLTVLCSSYGKAVLCEKPAAMVDEDVKRIKQAVERTNIPYMTAQVVRFWTGYTEIKRMMDQGEFGEIYMSYFSRCSERQEWGNDWLFDPELGGGAMHDMLVHDVDFMNYMFGPAKRAYAIATKDDTRCYENVFASIEYENGVKGAAETSFTMCSGYPFTMSAKVMGSKATAEFVYSAGYDINQREGARIEMRVFRKGETPRIFSPEPYDAYTRQLAYFLDCVENGETPSVVTIDDSINVIRTITAINKSADCGMPVEVLRDV